MKKYPHVFSPIRVGGVVLKNRIISAPTTPMTTSSGQPYPTEEGISFFEQRAKSGAGLVTCAGASVGGGYDDGIHCSWDLKKPNNTNRLADLAERIHMYGAKCTMELHGLLPDGYTCSDGNHIMGGDAVGREMPIEKIRWFVGEYAEAAKTLKSIGFDGILLHTGHSIPLAQFMSPLTNHRTDEYGGSRENRCRFAIEILDGIRAACGPDFIIDVRMSGTEYEPGGIDLEEGLAIAELLQDHCDILQASCGMVTDEWMAWTHPCGFLPPNPNVYIAEGWKKSGRITRAFITTLGGITNLSDCEEILASGKADFIMVARQFIADPDWIKKDLAGRPEDVTPCIKCMRCHDSDNFEQHFQCAVNPRAGLEAAIERVPPAEAKKNVAVIGGGPAGMYAALACAERGHTVTLFEKLPYLGGLLEYADHVSFKWPLANYKNWLIMQVNKNPAITVKLNTQATAEAVAGFDSVIAALGSEPVVPRWLPGVEHCRTAVSAYGHEAELGDKIAIIGGGQVGLETAVHLQKLGKEVTLLEMLPELAGDASPTHRGELMTEVKNHSDKLHVLCNAKCTGVEPGIVRYEKEGESHILKADNILLAVGLRARRDEADSFMNAADSYFAIGDCVRARTVEWCTKEGFYAALNV